MAVNCVQFRSLSCVRLFAAPWTAAYQAPPSMGFSGQQYWSGVPLPSPILWLHRTIIKYHLNLLIKYRLLRRLIGKILLVKQHSSKRALQWTEPDFPMSQSRMAIVNHNPGHRVEHTHRHRFVIRHFLHHKIAITQKTSYRDTKPQY